MNIYLFKTNVYLLLEMKSSQFLKGSKNIRELSLVFKDGIIYLIFS